MCPKCKGKLLLTLLNDYLIFKCLYCNVYWKDKKLDEINNKIKETEEIEELYAAISSSNTPEQFLNAIHSKLI